MPTLKETLAGYLVTDAGIAAELAEWSDEEFADFALAELTYLRGRVKRLEQRLNTILTLRLSG